MSQLRLFRPCVTLQPQRFNRYISSSSPFATSASSSIKLQPKVQSLLDRLHALSIAQEQASSSAVAELRDLRRRDPEAGNKALHNLMTDSFVALDQDKCEFIHQLALIRNAKTIVEVGTSFGVSTIYLAAAVACNHGREGKVIGTELEKSKAEKAKRHWQEAGDEISSRIELRQGDLRETLTRDLPEIDFVLIDSKSVLWSLILH